jgi:long-chain acyl-CoA synthetase
MGSSMAFYPTVRDLLDQTAAKYPEKTGIRDPANDAELTFGEWDERVTRVANSLLDHDLTPGDRLSIVLKDSIEFPTLVFAAAEAGLICNPIDYRASPGRLEYILDHSGSNGLVYDASTADTVGAVDDADLPDLLAGPSHPDIANGPEFASFVQGSAISPQVQVGEADTALLLYTSGTTGRPKGVQHTHRNVVQADLLMLPYNRLRPGDVSLALGPLYHVGPLLCNFMPALHVGATNVVQRDFDPGATLDYIEYEGVSALWGVPTHFNELIDHDSVADRDLTNVRMIQYSGDVMPREVVRECREEFQGVDFVNAYGATEFIPACLIHPENHDDHLGSIGRSIPNTATRVVDPDDPDPDDVVEQGETGEILVRTPTAMEGYWRDPERTAEAFVDDWYCTGDLARRDEEGFIYFIDRKDDMIVSGGENIYPAEVEDVLHEHPDVHAAAIIGTPHEKWGEAVTAFVVSADPDLSEDDLDAFCTDHDGLEAFKRPRRYRFLEELPKTETGKISRTDLETFEP